MEYIFIKLRILGILVKQNVDSHLFKINMSNESLIAPVHDLTQQTLQTTLITNITQENKSHKLQKNL